MASRKDLSATLDWQEVALTMEAFEVDNDCRIVLQVTFAPTNGQSDLHVQAQAFPITEDITEVKVLASASAKCRAEGFKTLGGLISFLLYQLDFQLELSEFDKVKEG